MVKSMVPGNVLYEKTKLFTSPKSKSWVPWPGELCHSTALGQQIVVMVTVSSKPNASCISRDRRAQKCFSGKISCYLEAIPTSEFHNVEKL